jgi:hypothetical protein
LALRNCQDDKNNHAQSCDSNCSPYNHLYRSDRKDSEVKEQDTDFGQEDVGRVEGLSDVNVLKTVSRLPL